MIKADTDFWDTKRGVVRSRKGGWVIGEAVYSHGYSMLDDLVGKASFFQVLILNATGRLPERRLADWLEATFTCMSWPDARIWCNHIGSLAGTMRVSPIAAVSAGILASDSHMYGAAPLLAGAEFIVNALAKKRKGLSAEDIIEEQKRHSGSKPIIVGYARPLAKGDERIKPLERFSTELGFKVGDHLALAYEIHEVLLTKYNESMNINGYMTAFLSDEGYTPIEILRMCSTIVNSGVHACYAEAADQSAESFLPMRCDDIEYQGQPPRSIPENN